MTLSELRARFVESMNEGASENKRQIYRNMLRYITEIGWYFDDLSDVARSRITIESCEPLAKPAA